MDNRAENISGIDWRYTAYKPRLGPFDAYLVFPPILLFAIHVRWSTFFLMLLVIVSMWLVEIFLSMPLKIALRSLRNQMAGSIRPAIPWWKKLRL